MSEKQLVYLKLDVLHPHPDNPRKDLGDLTELTDSIKAQGLFQPLTVVPYFSAVHQKNMKGMYTIIIGHRRASAAKLAGLTEVPCIITDLSPKEQLETMMVENVQRSDLTILEQADGFQLMLNLGSTVEDIAGKTGISKTTVRRRLQLNELDRKHLKAANERGGTLADYERLMKIKDPKRRDNVLRDVGTPAFQRQLQIALEQQETNEYLDGVEEILKTFHGCRPQKDENLARWSHNGWTLDQEFSQYQRKAPVEPADGKEYIWVREPLWLGLLRKTEISDKSTEEEEQYHKMAEGLKEIRAELESYNKFYAGQRLKFLQQYKVRKMDEPDIIESVLSAFHTCMNQQAYCYEVRPDTRTVAKIIGCKTKTVTGHEMIPDEDWETRMTLNPMLCMAACWYGGLVEGAKRGCYTTSYDHEANIAVPIFKANTSIDKMYNGLMDLGYEIGDEEFQLMDGTHPLYQKAQNLVAEYKKWVADHAENN